MSADPIDRAIQAILIAKLENWATEMDRSAKAMREIRLDDAARGNTALAEDIRAGVRHLMTQDTELSRLRAEVEEMRRALEPFRLAVESADDETIRDDSNAWESPMAMSVTYGDFRRAAALTGGGQAGGVGENQGSLPPIALLEAWRQAAARIIEPDAYDAFGGVLSQVWHAHALSVADQIAALPEAPRPIGIGSSGTERSECEAPTKTAQKTNESTDG